MGSQNLPSYLYILQKVAVVKMDCLSWIGF